MENKYIVSSNNSLYILGIVGVVAVVGLVLFFSQGVAAGASEGISGEAVFSQSNVIQKNDLFLLPIGAFVPTTTSTVGELLQYKGADKISTVNPKIKFKLLSTGESLEYAVPVSKQPVVDLKLHGKMFKVKLTKPTQIDSPLQIDLNGDGTVDDVSAIKLFSRGQYGLKGLGYTCDQVLTLQEGEGKKIGPSDNKLLKLVSLDGQEAVVEVKTITATSFTVEKSVPFFNGETVDVDLYSVHLLNLNNPAGTPQATFCVNF